MISQSFDAGNGTTEAVNAAIIANPLLLVASFTRRTLFLDVGRYATVLWLKYNGYDRTSIARFLIFNSSWR